MAIGSKPSEPSRTFLDNKNNRKIWTNQNAGLEQRTQNSIKAGSRGFLISSGLPALESRWLVPVQLVGKALEITLSYLATKRRGVKARSAMIVVQYSRNYGIWRDIIKVKRKLFVPAARKLFAHLNIINNICAQHGKLNQVKLKI